MAALTLLNGVQLPSRTKQAGLLPRYRAQSSQCFTQAPAGRCCSLSLCSSHASASQIQQLPRMARLGGRGRPSKLSIRNTYPEPETEKERSPLDYPQVPFYELSRKNFGSLLSDVQVFATQETSSVKNEFSSLEITPQWDIPVLTNSCCCSPQEWITPQPSRRPDIFPEFEKLDTPMPRPMPGDPEQPDEEEEEEEEKKKKPDKEDPDKDKPDEPQPDSE